MFKLSKSEYREIEQCIRSGSMVSLSPAIVRELNKVRRVGEDRYHWRRVPMNAKYWGLSK